MDTLDVKAREFTSGKDWSVSLIVELHKFLLQQDFKDEHQVILTILRVIRDAEVAEAKLLEESKEKALPTLPWNEYKKIVLEVCPAIHSAFLDPMKQLNTFLGEIEDVFEVPRPSSQSEAKPVPSCFARLFSVLLKAYFSDAKAPEAKASEVKTPEVKTSDAKAPEVKTPEAKAPQVKTSWFGRKLQPASPVVPVDNTRGGLEIRSALPALPGSLDLSGSSL
jgi:hypothetical protein